MAAFVKEPEGTNDSVFLRAPFGRSPEYKRNSPDFSIFSVNYCKAKPINIDSLVENWEKEDVVNHPFYEPYKIHHLQQYNPIYSVFFELNDKNYNSISFNHKYHVHSLREVISVKTGAIIEKDVFVKFSPLIDPIRYMTGKYGSLNLDTPESLKLPQLKHTDAGHEPKSIEHKLFSIHNASYVDCFFYYLSSMLLNKCNFVHGIDFYGSYLGIQKYFKVNIEEDTEYLENFDFFNSNVDKLFFMENWKSQNEREDRAGGSSHKNKKKIQILSFDNRPENESDIIPIITPDVLDIPLVAEKKHSYESDIIEMYSKKTLTNNNDSSEEDESTEDDNDSTEDDDADATESDDDADAKESDDDADAKESDDDADAKESDDDVSTEWKDETGDDCVDEEDANEEDLDEEDLDEEDSDDDDEDDITDENETYSYIKNFPVQMICMEKCDGTLDRLFMEDAIDEMSGLSAMFQIIMTLIIYQEVFHFTHNDLHTNNITYVETERTHLYYKFNDIVYRVPTYGRIYKIIDFGRAIYKFQNKTFCSDSFSSHGDASTQYNFPPFYNTKKPLVLPNYSFDLCRLGCSIYDFVIEENTYKPVLKHMDNFQRLIYELCLDDEGKNILYKKSGDERFPGFKLYKAISHKVTQHTPQNQLQKPVFRRFVCNKQRVKETHRGDTIDIDAIKAGLRT